MRARPSTDYLIRARQQGAVTVIVVLFLLLVLGAALGAILQTSGSGATDATAQDDSVAALFLAESGVERALARLPVDGCAAGLAMGPLTLGRGSFQVQNPVVIGANCQVDVRGTVGTTLRTLRVLLNVGGGTITATATNVPGAQTATRTFTHTVVAGQTLLLVGISVDRTDTLINTVSFNGQPLALVPGARATQNASRPKAEIWFLLNPPAVTADVVVALSASDEVIANAISFSQVNTVTPWDVPAVTARGTSSPASVTITPITNGAWVVDVLAANNNPDATMTSVTGRLERWNSAVTTRLRGAGSTMGPISPALAQNLRWAWTSGNRDWVQAAVALRPGGSPRLLQWQELVN